ncbi:uncharacterized protein PV09_05667 [Verruconis gallopava]|uniref:Major facilitator superfamily (MFS) profile domain-containing protein n=1 Tax=Verruconis gallopava TaxID=253628 RepID=A0A0D2AV70_9PEZI|nr:uncharacterized protein PV09_05667 [Verruconis gallopava]KIW03009.1 hypothetical protein PV09_05667 [Verruconis gallopava]
MEVHPITASSGGPCLECDDTIDGQLFDADEKVASFENVAVDQTDVPDLNRTLSRRTIHSTRSAIDPEAEPPDGGLHAWLKVFGCFLMYANTLSFQVSFGAYQTYYQRSFLSNMSPSAISWIGTIQSWFLITTGVVSGPLFDLGYFRPMLFVGNTLIIFGLFMLSISRSYASVFLSQGACIGLGIGLLFVPSMALLGLSFKKRLSLAQGIVTSGNAVGGIAYTIAFDRLSKSRGFDFAVRTQAFISIGMAALAIPALLTGTSALARARTARKIWEKAAFRDPLFLMFTASVFAGNLGYITPYFFFPSFAQDCLGASQSQAFYILIYSIAASAAGRLLTGSIGHYVGPIMAWAFCAATAGTMCFTWMAIATQKGMIAWAVVWGFCSAGLVTLPSASFPGLCPDPRRLGSRSGMSFSIASFSALLGPPIAGALIKRSNQGSSGRRPRSEYLGAQVWAGSCLVFDAVLVFILWRMAVRRQMAR